MRKNIVRQISGANEKISPVMNECTEGNVTRCAKSRALCKMAEGRFASVCPIQNLFERKKRKIFK